MGAHGSTLRPQIHGAWLKLQQSSCINKVSKGCFTVYLVLLRSEDWWTLEELTTDLQAYNCQAQDHVVHYPAEDGCIQRSRIFEHIKDNRTDVAASMCLAWKQNMHKCVGAYCWLIENVFISFFSPGCEGEGVRLHQRKRCKTPFASCSIAAIAI